MSRTSVGQSQPRPHSGRKTLRKCKNNGTTDNVVLIDVDSDDFENVIFIDVPDSVSKKLRGSSVGKDKRHPWRTVICIDDDESSENVDPDIGVKESCNNSNGASSSKRSFPAADVNGKSSDGLSDDCQFVQENISPVKISKCKRTYSGKAPARNCYGLGSESDDDLSDDDLPDCELVEEDSAGSFRKQWEKASSKRKCENRNGQSGVGGCSNSSTVSADAKKSVDEGNTHGQPKESSIFSRSGKPSCEKEDSSSPTATGNLPRDSENSKRTSFADNVLEFLLKERFSYNKANLDSSSDPLAEVSAMKSGENQYPENSCHDIQGSKSAGQGPKLSSFNLPREHSAEEVDTNRKASEEEVGPVSGGEYMSCSSSLFNSGMNSRKYSHVENEELMDEKFASCSNHVNEVEPEHRQCFSHEAEEYRSESVANRQNKNDENVNAQDDETMHGTKSCCINDREKLKETEEYKKAIEEEWASRQRALQIQAEEAQQQRRLRKRRNAERMRLLDMERRQKQRLEDIRETQKKDEEQMNMKELIRAEVMKELSNVEIACRDMASLLRSLGIQVGSGLQPKPDEVRVACKRALFAFHPDRASKSDIRQQVEAEEKFKLISRMKEKFLHS